MLLPLILLLFSDKPIHVAIDDPIVDFKVTSLDGHTYQTSSLINSGFIIFFSLTCPECIKSIDTYNKYFTKGNDAILLLTETDRDLVLKYLAEHQKQIYFVSEEDLRRINIQVLPAMLGYKEQKLQIAFHGPLDEKNALMILDYFNR